MPSVVTSQGLPRGARSGYYSGNVGWRYYGMAEHAQCSAMLKPDQILSKTIVKPAGY